MKLRPLELEPVAAMLESLRAADTDCDGVCEAAAPLEACVEGEADAAALAAPALVVAVTLADTPACGEPALDGDALLLPPCAAGDDDALVSTGTMLAVGLGLFVLTTAGVTEREVVTENERSAVPVNEPDRVELRDIDGVFVTDVPNDGERDVVGVVDTLIEVDEDSEFDGCMK